MFTIGKLTYLNIDKKSFSSVADTKGSIDYQKWVNYIDENQGIFVWYEDTEDGKNILKNIKNIPEEFQRHAPCFVE